MSKETNTFLSSSHTPARKCEDDNSSVFTCLEFIKEAEITEQRAKELLDLGWLQPVDSDTIKHDSNNSISKDLVFKQSDVFRAREANKLCIDFELPSLAGAMIVDLLKKIDDLEAQLKEKE